MRRHRTGGILRFQRRAAVTAGLLGLFLLGIRGAAGLGQETIPAAEPAGIATDLGTHYRFQERYAVRTDTPPQGAIGQYKVAYKETIKSYAEKARSAPARDELTIHAIYQERPADVSSTDERKITAAVRHYEMVEIRPNPQAKPAGPPPFRDLTVWCRPRNGELPEILVLAPKDHRLTDIEYFFAAKQSFVPDLTFVLPERPILVGGTWPLTRTGTSALFGAPAGPGLLGKFREIRADPDRKRKRAILVFTGQVDTADGPASVHAQVHYAFPPPAAGAKPLAGEVDRDPNTAVDIPGEIVRLVLAEEIAVALSPNGRLRQNRRRELILERQSGDPGPLMTIPAAPPVADVENSWLSYVDPKGRFNFRHPQEFHPQPITEPDLITLVRPWPLGEADQIDLSLEPKSKLDPESIRKDVTAAYKAQKLDLVPGAAGWLPEADWPKMKVYQLELDLVPAGEAAAGAQRKHFRAYAAQTGRERGLYVEAQTVRYPTAPFWKDVEKIIKTFQFGPQAAGGR